MKYKGWVKKEGLKDEGFLNFATSKKEEKGQILFEAEDEFAASIIAEMSEELRIGSYFGVVKNEYKINVIFPEKICSFTPNNQEEREKMIKYGTSLEIGLKDLQNI